MLRRAGCAILVVTAWTVTPIEVAHAQLFFIYDWNNPSGGSYASQFNWTSITGGIPDNSNEIARFQQVNAAYSVQIGADYTVGILTARQQGNVTLAFTPPTGFPPSPRKIYATGELSVDPTLAGTVTLGLSEGDVRVSGDTFVGRDTSNGQANLDVLSGRLTTVGTQVGAGPDSAGYVTVGDIGNWTDSGTLVLGGAGDALLDIVADYRTSCFISCFPFPSQGQVTNSGVVMGQSGASHATANVYGLWNTGDLIVGDAGVADVRVLATQLLSFPQGINVSSAGSVTSATVSIGAQPGSSGSVNVVGAAFGPPSLLLSGWNITGSLALGGTSGAPGGAGQLTIGPGNTVMVGSNLRMWSDATLTLAEQGVLSITGGAFLGGTLEFLLAPMTTPQLNDTFQILSAGGVAGTFSSTILPPLGPGLVWSVEYGPASVSLKVVALLGDYNQNGTVDAGDYVVWREAKESFAVDLPNDENAPGFVGAAEYSLWRTHFGQTAGSGSGASGNATVPEPSTLIQMFLAAVGWNLRRRRPA